MSIQKLDEEAEVAREIGNSDICAKYLSQVCNDPYARLRLEQRLKLRRRWQFGLRTLFAIMIVAAVVSAFLGGSINSAIQAQRLAERERLRALQAAEQAQAAMLQLKISQSKENTS